MAIYCEHCKARIHPDDYLSARLADCRACGRTTNIDLQVASDTRDVSKSPKPQRDVKKF